MILRALDVAIHKNATQNCAVLGRHAQARFDPLKVSESLSPARSAGDQPGCVRAHGHQLGDKFNQPYPCSFVVLGVEHRNVHGAAQ